MSTPRRDRVAIRQDARLTVVRAAAGVVRVATGRTVAEDLCLALPIWTAEGADHPTIAAALAAEVLPGAPWLVDVVAGTLSLWSRPDCPERYQSRLGLPTLGPVLQGAVSVASVTWEANPETFDDELRQHDERVWQLDQADRERARRRRRTPGTDNTRSPRPLSERDALLFARYQWAPAALHALARETGLSAQGVDRAIRRAAHLVGVDLREPLPAGRPANC